MKLAHIMEPFVLLAAPLVMFGCCFLPAGQAALVSAIAAAIAIGFVAFDVDRSRPPLQSMMPTVVLAALAAAGRILFALIPDFKPVSAICILAGVTFGKRSGFLVGALAALVSNFFFGQGFFTLWQMYAWGLVGYLAGVLAQHNAFSKMPVLLCFGFASALLYGFILNGWTVMGFVRPLTWPAVLATYAAGLPYDLLHGVATVVFLSVLYLPWRRKLQRIQQKYALLA